MQIKKNSPAYQPAAAAQLSEILPSFLMHKNSPHSVALTLDSGGHAADAA